jgi:hypothetical protein
VEAENIEKVITSRELMESLKRGDNPELAKEAVIDLPHAILLEIDGMESEWSKSIRDKYSEEVIVAMKKQMTRQGWLTPTWNNGKMGLRLGMFGEHKLKQLEKETGAK